MAEVEIQMRSDEARLVFLALAHHLGRPGSELDPITKQPVEHGLAEVAADLQPQLRLATSRIRLNSNQLQRLMSGMLGSITELKAYPMLELRDPEAGGMRSTVPGFDSTLRHLFPSVEEDAENAYDIAEHMMMLKRRFDERIATMPRDEVPPPPAPKKRGWWPFGR